MFAEVVLVRVVPHKVRGRLASRSRLPTRECTGRDPVATLCEFQHRMRLWNRAADGAPEDQLPLHHRRRLTRFCYGVGTTPGPKD
jgi:hypothetical protein